MTRNMQARLIALFSLAALAAGGCFGITVQREALDAAANVAVVSVVTPLSEVRTTKANRKVLQEEMDHAADQVQRGLAGIRTWKVVDPSARKAGRAVLASFGEVNRAELAAVFVQPDEQDRAKKIFGEQLKAWKEQFTGARGLLTVPREALLPDEELEQQDETVRPLARFLAGKLCRELQVDAVAFVQVRYAVTHPRESFIVTDDRTDGLLALSTTITIVDRTGTIIVNTGLRPADETSRHRDLLPLYRGAGKDAVRPENIDLADRKKKVSRAFTELVDESVADLMDLLKEALRR